MPAEDKRKVSEELESLELEERRFRVRELRSQQAQRRMHAATTEQTLSNEREQKRRTVAGCSHRKGGKGSEMWFRGNDANFAVVKHILSHGPMIVVCQRCGNEWMMPEPLKRGATLEERQAYVQAVKEFQWAVNLPTDNTTSGTALFMTIPAQPEQQLVTA
jgi:hypothetical protein